MHRSTRTTGAIATAFVCAALLGACSSSEAAEDVPSKPGATQVPDVPDRWDSTPASDGKVIYLTFDDGPGVATPAILDILHENDAKATFFLVGKMIRTREAIRDRVLADGHVLGDHTWDHADLAKMKKKEAKSQLIRTAKAVGPQMGPCFRPPYGAIDDQLRTTAKSIGMTPVMWSKDTHDFAGGTSAAEIEKTLTGAQNGDVILMHDGGGNRDKTVAALKAALPKLKADGFRFETVPVCRPPQTEGGE